MPGDPRAELRGREEAKIVAHPEPRCTRRGSKSNGGATAKIGFTMRVAVGTLITERPPQSGRIEARTGLRMMPTSPRSSLSFRTAGFPQYGWKAGCSGGAFPGCCRLKPAPGIPHATSGLLPPFVHLVVSSMIRTAPGRGLDCAPPGGLVVHRPRGPRSGPGCYLPVRPHLIGPIRPTRRHIATSPQGGLYAMPSLCGSA